jgi:hypothetical protein
MPDARTPRVAGFALTVAGAFIAGIGTTLVWTSTGLRTDVRGVLDLEFRGLDLAEGVVASVIAALALVALVALGRVQERARARVAIGLLLAGVALVALPAWVALRAKERAIDEVARIVAETAGVTIEEATDRVRTDPDLAVRAETAGVWPSIAGGALVMLGTGTILAWARRPQRGADEP